MKRLTIHKTILLNFLDDYSTIKSEAKYKLIHEKERPDILACRAKISDLKILTSKQMLQRLPIVLA